MSAGWNASEHVIELRPSRFGRVATVPFLLVWLTGWAFGEIAVISVLVAGVLKVLRGEESLSGGMVGLAAFLLVWLTFWTIGGIAAIRHVLSLVWAVDQIAVNPAGIGVQNKLGPFRSFRELRRDQIVSIGIEGRLKALVAETRRGSVRLSSLGTLVQREEAARELREHLAIQESSEEEWVSAALPKGWVEVIDEQGRPALVRDPIARAKQARVVTALALGVTLGALWLVGAALKDPSKIPIAMMAAAADAGLIWGALWLARGRNEWRLGSGLLHLRRRFGGRVRDVFEAHALELTLSSDSDGDEWLQLDALDRQGAQEDLSRLSLREASKAASRRHKSRRTILRSPNESRDVRRLARWLAERTQIPLRDLTTSEARADRRAVMRRQLQQAGALGRLLGRLVDRAEVRRRN